ncbi:MAG: hypothetical protein ACYSU8_08815, partial [Planctomycetota bacterium]
LTGCPFLFLGFVCFLLAFIFGIIGWKTPQGKIAAIGVPCLGLLILPGLLLLSFFHFKVPNSVAVEQVRAEQQPALIATAVRANHPVSHKSYPMDTLEGLLSQDMAEIDEEIYVNGGASLRIKSDSSEKSTIRLYEIGPMSVENRMLIYSAQMKSDLSHGKAYLEMWCEIPGKGEFFSRGLEQPISGTTNWTTVQTPFRLEPGQKPVNVKLNLVTEGEGTIWIDDVKLSSSPLNYPGSIRGVLPEIAPLFLKEE